jgi:tetratricopeptide (TPR) repeat protein
LRRVVVWFFSTAALCVWGMAVYYLGVFVIAPSVPPERAFSAAQAMVSSGQYAKASRAFEQFAAEFPQHPANGEARFQTANCLLLASGGLEDEEKNLYLALEKLTAFISENPGHVRIPRARTLLGQTCFKLKDFTRATEILGDPALPAEDTEGAASILRTLARANVATGQYAAAESAYLKLTALPGNNWVAVDREELGDLFSIRANRAKGDERRQLLRAASEQLNMAIQVSGTDPESRDRLQLKCNHLLTELGGLPK